LEHVICQSIDSMLVKTLIRLDFCCIRDILNCWRMVNTSKISAMDLRM